MAVTPYIDNRPVVDFAEIKTSVGVVRVYHPIDAIMDRVTHFVHWSDSEALRVAERAVWSMRNQINATDIDRAFEALQTLDRPGQLRAELARKRLHDALQNEALL